jgi:hypothetical protein
LASRFGEAVETGLVQYLVQAAVEGVGFGLTDLIAGDEEFFLSFLAAFPKSHSQFYGGTFPASIGFWLFARL